MISHFLNFFIFYFLKIVSSRDDFSMIYSFLKSSFEDTIFHFQFISYFLLEQNYDRFKIIFPIMVI